ncbi:MAG: hypothetical protein EP344_03980 [Bacteroidetes bacterium]|nr:MAG: hypothetical protein EP344_03980 [Bacteroidota bacterium]
MKKQINLLVATFLACTTAFAAMPSNISVTIEKGTDAGTIQVEMNGLDQQNTQVVVQDMSGKQWVRESVKKVMHYRNLISLAGVPSGEYVLFVKGRNILKTRAFTLEGQEVRFFNLEESAANNGGLKLDAGGVRNCIVRISNAGNENLRVQLSNLQEYEATIQLVSLKGSLKFEKALQNEQAYAKNVDLSNLSPGAYILYIKVGDTALIQEVSVAPTQVELGKVQRKIAR